MSSQKRKIWISMLHSLWMVLLVFILQKLPVIFNYEVNLTHNLWETEFYARFGKVKDHDKFAQKFFFVNTARSFEIDDEAPSGTANLRTNREQLLSVLKSLNANKNDFEVIFLDIFVPEASSETDEELQKVVAELKQHKKIVTVTHVVNYYEPMSNLPSLVQSIKFHSNDYTLYEGNAFGDSLSGPAYYPLSNSDAFFKFTYNVRIEDELRKQAPLLLYECISDKTAKNPFLFGLFYKYNGDGRFYQNIYIPKIILNNNDLHYFKTEEFAQNAEFLSELAVDEEFLQDKLSREPGKIIFIGDLSFGDIHYAKGARISGSLLVANTMIALMEAHNRISILYLIFLVLAFAVISYFTFWPKMLKKENQRKIRFRRLNSVYRYMISKSNYLILLATSLIGIFIFKQYIFLFFILIYIFLLNKTIGFLDRKKQV
ncbi:MAG: hypothetical protein PHO74_06060 [Weeksellaceae bacterium]|nr:hypothetical protein [Weeksellaceae bacterium]